MTARIPIPGDRTTAVRLVALLLVAVAVAGAIVAPAAAASAATAQDDDSDGDGEIAIDRGGDYLDVTLSGFEEQPNEVTIEVDAANASTADERHTDDGAISVWISDLVRDIGHVPLDDANVTVTAGDATETKSLDLRTVAFASEDDAPVWIDDGEEPRVVLPLDRNDTVGITDDTLTVDVDGDDVEADVRANATQLAIDQETFVGAAGFAAEIDLEASVADGRATQRTLGPELRDTADGLVLWHPLLETGTTYELAAEDAEDGRQYVNGSAEPVRPGEIDLSPLSGANEVTVTLSAADGDALFEDHPVDVETPPSLSATVVNGGSAIEFDQGVDGLAVSTVVVNSSDGDVEQYGLEAAAVENGRLALGDVTVSPSDELVLVTNAGAATVELAAAESDGESGGEGGLGFGLGLGLGDVPEYAAFLLGPVLIGFVVGCGSYRFRNTRTGKRLAVSAAFSLWLSAMLAIGLLAFGSAELMSLTPFHGFALGGVALGTTVAAGTYYALGYPPGSGRPTGFEVSVTVTDGEQPLQGRTKVHYQRKTDAENPKEGNAVISGGKGRVRIPDSGTWKLRATRDSARSVIEEVDRQRTSVTLPISFPPATVTVTDRADGEPIPGATVTRGDDGRSQTTDESGVVRLEPGAGYSSVEVAVSHEKYEGRETTIEFPGSGEPRIELAPRTGRVRLVSRVDGVPIGSTPLRLSPREKSLDRRYGTIRVTTGSDGTAARDGLLIGQYRAEIAPPGGRDDLFDGGKSVLTVREDRSTRVEVDARFTWSLSSAHRDRIDGIRRRLRSLSEQSGRDTTIPRYYGSVVAAILETVESLPDSGHRFAHEGADPDAVADALLDAAEQSADAIGDAMTTKRNVDLFAACADMPDPGVDWDGDCDLEAVLERLESDAMTQRNVLKDRYEAVTERVESERGSVSEAAPAEEMLRRAWRMGSDAGSGDEAIVTIHAALLLFDAVEGVFERESLRDRLSRTVF